MSKNTYFNITISLFVLFLSCGTAKHAGSGTTGMPGTWQATPIMIDGDCKDWPSPYPNYDGKAMVAYATSNDKENLYVTMQTGDELTQMKILRQGMTLLIDTTGKKDGQLKVNFPLQNDNDPLDMADDYGGKMNVPGSGTGRWSKKIAKSAEHATQMAIEGFKECSGGYSASQSNACGIKVRLRIDEYKELIWEAVIPFKAIYGKEAISAAFAGKPISVCFAVKGFKQPGGKKGDDNGTMMNNSNMGTGGMGMNSRMNANAGGRGRPADNPMQHLYENTKTWKQFGLAYQ